MVIAVPIPSSVGTRAVQSTATLPEPIDTIDPSEYFDPFDLAEIALIEPGVSKIQPYEPPFTIVVDKNEGLPYRFTGLRTDGESPRPIIVSTIAKALYQMGQKPIQIKGKWFTKGLADYSIDGFEERIQVERKSLEDLYGTLGSRRDEFEAEISRLNLCDFAAVIVEASWHDILENPPSYSRLIPKTISRTVQSWSMRYPRVHWFTLSGRQHAENFTFRLLEMFWRQAEHAKKDAAAT